MLGPSCFTLAMLIIPVSFMPLLFLFCLLSCSLLPPCYRSKIVQIMACICRLFSLLPAKLYFGVYIMVNIFLKSAACIDLACFC